MTTPTGASVLAPPRSNAAQPWDDFDSQWYLWRNYGRIHHDDRVIINLLAPFFAAAGQRSHGHWRGIDVGSGTNLYPALAMLPLCRTITLWEHSATNVSWLWNGIRPYSQSWDQFWDSLCQGDPMYQRYKKPRAMLPVTAKVEKASVFHLPVAEWDIGTMFFVAESITGIYEEFEDATRSFLRSLKPGSPFAAAFMRNSLGYPVGAHRFPAVAVTKADVQRVVRPFTADRPTIEEIEPGEKLREGYQGMIFVTGTTSTRR